MLLCGTLTRSRMAPPDCGVDNVALIAPHRGVIRLPSRIDDEPQPGTNGAEHDFVSRDIGHTQAWLVALLRRDLLLEPLRRDGFEARLTGYALAGANVIHAAYAGGLRLKRGDAHDNLTLRIVASGGSFYSVGQETLAAVPGRGLILNTAQAESGEYAEGSIHSTFTIHAEEVARTLQNAFERPVTEPLALAATFDVTSGNGAALSGIMAAMAACLGGESVIAEAPHAARMLRDALIMLILERFPHRYSAWFERSAAAPAPWQIRRAVAFIDAHGSGPLTVQDVADAVGIGLRSLQEGFRRHRQISPHDYIKQVRLARVRTELLNPQSTRSIEAVARHWGFVNRGHFAVDYRQAFGEQPSETRRRR